MDVTFGSYTRCIKNFTPMRVITKYKSEKAESFTNYFLFDKNSKILGGFVFDNSGRISDVYISPSIRKTKTLSDALFTMRDFVVGKAKENKWDYITFSLNETQARLIKSFKKLFTGLGADFIGRDQNRTYNFVGIINQKKREKILQDLTIKPQIFSVK